MKNIYIIFKYLIAKIFTRDKIKKFWKIVTNFFFYRAVIRWRIFIKKSHAFLPYKSTVHFKKRIKHNICQGMFITTKLLEQLAK